MPETLEREDLFDASFLDRLRVLALRLRKRRQLMRRGSQSTPATGFTREFKDYRHYTPREDYRAIDWRLYARLEKLFVRLYEETQELNLHILLDTSTSMAQPFPEKRRQALRFAVALAYLALWAVERWPALRQGAVAACLTGIGQQTLQAARSFGASGAEFQAIFKEVNKGLLETQGQLEERRLKLQEQGITYQRETLDEVIRLRVEQVNELRELREQLRRDLALAIERRA